MIWVEPSTHSGGVVRTRWTATWFDRQRRPERSPDTDVSRVVEKYHGVRDRVDEIFDVEGRPIEGSALRLRECRFDSRAVLGRVLPRTEKLVAVDNRCDHRR